MADASHQTRCVAQFDARVVNTGGQAGAKILTEVFTVSLIIKENIGNSEYNSAAYI